MKNANYKTEGPLGKDDSSVYVVRNADGEVMRHIEQGNYILLLEASEQGKTSLLLRLTYIRQLRSYTRAYIDLSGIIASIENDWFQHLGHKIVTELPDKLRLLPLPPFLGSSDWTRFLMALCINASLMNHRIILMFDEIGTVPSAWNEHFYSGLRAFYNERANKPERIGLTCIFAGKNIPDNILKNRINSPFNVAHRVRLHDFNIQQTNELANFTYHNDQFNTIYIKELGLPAKIYDWTDGHPYLTQWLFRYVQTGEQPSLALVDKGADELLRKDEVLIGPLGRRIEANPSLHEHIRKMLKGDECLYHPNSEDWQKELELIGAIKEDQNNYCAIRNQLYRRVMQLAINKVGSQPVVSDQEDNPVNELMEAIRTISLVATTIKTVATVSDSIADLVFKLRSYWTKMHPHEMELPGVMLSAGDIREIADGMTAEDRNQFIRLKKKWDKAAIDCFCDPANRVDNSIIAQLQRDAAIDFISNSSAPAKENAIAFLDAVEQGDKMPELVSVILTEEHDRWRALRNCMLAKINQ